MKVTVTYFNVDDQELEIDLQGGSTGTRLRMSFEEFGHLIHRLREIEGLLPTKVNVPSVK